MSKVYETDFFDWTRTQADALRRRSGNEVDWDNVAEELETLGRSELRELRSRYVILLTHLLKWIHQPERRSRSWSNTIAVQREAIMDHLDANPSLRARASEEYALAWREARRHASTETDLDVDVFPAEPDIDIDKASALDWMPQ